jgi:mRNA interferase MazF
MQEGPPVPEPGDVVWLDFSPHKGREQAGHRPAVVLSPKSYNTKTGLALLCPVTSRVKGYPFEVKLSGPVAGVALADHIRSLDWRVRGARVKGRITPEELAEIRGKVWALIRA